MAGIRTVMVTTPALFGDLIKRLAVHRIDLDVVGELNGRRGLARRLQKLRPHLVILGLQPNETDTLIRALLVQLPDSKLITLSYEGRCIAGYELRLCRTPLSDRSPDELINFIGAVAAGIGA